MLHRGIKSNFIPPVTYLQRSTNAEQPHSINARRLSFPRWSRFLIQNISQKCSRDDHKMTLGGLHGRGMVHSSGVGAPMVPRGQVIHHQQRYIDKRSVAAFKFTYILKIWCQIAICSCFFTYFGGYTFDILEIEMAST